MLELELIPSHPPPTEHPLIRDNLDPRLQHGLLSWYQSVDWDVSKCAVGFAQAQSNGGLRSTAKEGDPRGKVRGYERS